MITPCWPLVALAAIRLVDAALVSQARRLHCGLFARRRIRTRPGCC